MRARSIHVLLAPGRRLLRRRAAVCVALAVAGAAACAPEPLPEPPRSAIAETVLRPSMVRSADGVRIAFTEDGVGSPALVFVHGWAADQSYWAGQIEPFVADHRVVTLDLAGHGRSEGQRQVWTPAAFGEDVRAVIEALELERAIVVGHALGAVAGVEAARRLPGRVIGVIGIDAFHDVHRRPDAERWARLLRSFERDFDGTCGTFVRFLFTPTARGELVGRVASDLCAASPSTAIESLRALPDYDTAAAVRAAGVPVRCINGTLHPTDVAGNRRAAPDFEAVIMPGVGHFPMLEQPAEFNLLLAQLVASFD